MKKNLEIFLIIGCITGLMLSCKKSTSPTPDPEPVPIPIDYSASIKGKVWWGKETIKGKLYPEYFSVYFKEDNSLTWTQISGEYEGLWVINGNQLIITSFANKGQCRAQISDDHKLSKFVMQNSDEYKVDSCEQIVDMNIALDNTKWLGRENDHDYPLAIDLRFSTDGAAHILDLHILFGDNRGELYTRSARGEVIRFGPSGQRGAHEFFGIISSDSTIKGAYLIGGVEYAFNLTRQ